MFVAPVVACEISWPPTTPRRGVAVLALCLDDLHGASDYCQADLNRARPSAISAGAWVVKENRSVARSGSPAKNG